MQIIRQSKDADDESMQSNNNKNNKTTTTNNNYDKENDCREMDDCVIQPTQAQRSPNGHEMHTHSKAGDDVTIAQHKDVFSDRPMQSPHARGNDSIELQSSLKGLDKNNNRANSLKETHYDKLDAEMSNETDENESAADRNDQSNVDTDHKSERNNNCGQLDVEMSPFENIANVQEKAATKVIEKTPTNSDNNASSMDPVSEIFVPIDNQACRLPSPVTACLNRGRRDSCQIISDLLEQDNPNYLDYHSNQQGLVDINNNSQNNRNLDNDDSNRYYNPKIPISGQRYESFENVHENNQRMKHYVGIKDTNARPSSFCQAQNADYYRQPQNQYQVTNNSLYNNNDNLNNSQHEQRFPAYHANLHPTGHIHSNQSDQYPYRHQSLTDESFWNNTSVQNQHQQQSRQNNSHNLQYASLPNDPRYQHEGRASGVYERNLELAERNKSDIYYQTYADSDQIQQRDRHLQTTNIQKFPLHHEQSYIGARASRYMIDAHSTSYPMYMCHPETSANFHHHHHHHHSSYSESPSGQNFSLNYAQQTSLIMGHQNRPMSKFIPFINDANNNYESVDLGFGKLDSAQEKTYHVLGEDQNNNSADNNDPQQRHQNLSKNDIAFNGNHNTSNSQDNNLDEMLMNYSMTTTISGDGCASDLNGLPILSKEYDPTEELNLLDYEPNEDDVDMHQSGNSVQRSFGDDDDEDGDEQEDDEDAEDEDDSDYGDASRCATNNAPRGARNPNAKAKSTHRAGSRCKGNNLRSCQANSGPPNAPRCSDGTIDALKRMLAIRKNQLSLCQNNGPNSSHRNSTSSTSSSSSSSSSLSSGSSSSSLASTPPAQNNHGSIQQSSRVPTVATRINTQPISGTNHHNHNNRKSGVLRDRKRTHTNRPMTRNWIKANGLLSSNV